ncbi:hypothetical protein HZA57_02690 [Candidatus Poribacteria bacterium]|nr:hypothetical protein [Candidatus Poribacteria bacterium]
MRGFLSLLILPVMVALTSSAHAFLVTPLDEGKLAVEVVATAPSREEALLQAKLEAVRGSAGRVLLSDQLILADGLLVKYLNNYGADFVTAVEVLSEEFLAGSNTIRARVFVDYDALVRDLAEKKFLYQPAYKPRFATFMEERLDDQISNEGVAREALSEALTALGMLGYEGELPTPPTTTDAASDELLLDAAVVSCQRSGVEVIVSGGVKTTLRHRKKLYYDEYWFYDTEMTAKVVRVDTREVLFTAKAAGSASDKNPTTAIRQAIERASEKIARQLVGEFQDFWPVVVQRKGDYEILLTGVDDELLGIIRQNLERLGREAHVYLRKKFDRTAVLAITYRGAREDVLDNLTSCPYPTLYIVNPDAKKYFEVQVAQ